MCRHVVPFRLALTASRAVAQRPNGESSWPRCLKRTCAPCGPQCFRQSKKKRVLTTAHNSLRLLAGRTQPHGQRGARRETALTPDAGAFRGSVLLGPSNNSSVWEAAPRTILNVFRICSFLSSTTKKSEIKSSHYGAAVVSAYTVASRHAMRRLMFLPDSGAVVTLPAQTRGNAPAPLAFFFCIGSRRAEAQHYTMNPRAAAQQPLATAHNAGWHSPRGSGRMAQPP